MVRILLCLLLLFPSHSLLAQETQEEPGFVEKYGPRRQISTIVYMGLAGAVLGLSTLSFYGRPQDHLTNIPIGFGVGVIIGTVYMTYQAATNPDEFYRESRYEYVPEFSEMPVQEISYTDSMVQPMPSAASYQWTF